MINGRGYEIGIRVQQKNHVIQVKVGNAKWMPESRYNWAVEKGEIPEGVKIYHRDGNVENNDTDNLIDIQFNTRKYVALKTSRILYVPKARQESEQIYKRFNDQKLKVA